MRSLLLAVLLLPVATGLPAQGREDPAELLETVAGLWARGDASAIARYAAEGGLDIEIDGRSMGPLGRRQAAAVLRRALGDHTTLTAATTKAARVKGTDDRAFGELQWTLRPEGAGYAERRTIFIGLVREPSGWRVSQIRILP